MIIRKLMIAAVFVGGLNAAVSGQDGLNIQLSPDGPIIINPTNRRFGYADLVVHNIGITNTGSVPLTVSHLSLEAMMGEETVLMKTVNAKRLIRDTGRAATVPVPAFAVFQLLNDKGVSGFLGDALPSRDRVLEQGEGLLTSSHHLSVDAVPDRVRITAYILSADGTTESVIRDVPIARYESPIAYQMPIKGAWFMRALPGIESHHRLSASTEFAVDFFKVTAQGTVYEGDRVQAESYVGYGAPVLAAADGTVVHVETSAVQDRAFFLPREGESREQRGQRMQQAMMKAFSDDARRAAGGNLITIRHTVGDTVEYSSYGHLKAGSVQVKVGDSVKAGDVIAAVGDTGDSPEVHLHFQVNTGDDAFTSKSLPVSFADMKHAVRPAEPGLIVRKGE